MGITKTDSDRDRDKATDRQRDRKTDTEIDGDREKIEKATKSQVTLAGTVQVEGMDQTDILYDTL